MEIEEKALDRVAGKKGWWRRRGGGVALKTLPCLSFFCSVQQVSFFGGFFCFLCFIFVCVCVCEEWPWPTWVNGGGERGALKDALHFSNFRAACSLSRAHTSCLHAISTSRPHPDGLKGLFSRVFLFTHTHTHTLSSCVSLPVFFPSV